MEAAHLHAYLGIHLLVSPPPDCDIDPLHLAELGHEEGQMSAASPVPVTHGTFSQSSIAMVLGQGRQHQKREAYGMVGAQEGSA